MTTTGKAGGLGRAKKLYEAIFFVADEEGAGVFIKGHADAQKLLKYQSAAEVREHHCYGGYEDYAYDQDEKTARAMLGAGFDFKAYERQRRAREKSTDNNNDGLSDTERLRKKAMAKIAKLSAEERAILGITIEVEADRNVVVVPSGTGTPSGGFASLMSNLGASSENEEDEEDEEEEANEEENEDEMSASKENEDAEEEEEEEEEEGEEEADEDAMEVAPEEDEGLNF